MNEQLLQFIWQHALYQSNAVKDTNGHPIIIVHPGYLNKDEGPDFSNARIKMDDIELVGNIEIHINASDWKNHQHQNHKAYQNIILHVVWNLDTTEVFGNFATVDIHPYVPEETLNKYEELIHQPAAIPCINSLPIVPYLHRHNWLDRLLVERWEQKLVDWKNLFQYLGNDWRQLLFVKLAENFGFKTNAAPMRLLAQTIPLSVVEKINNDPIQIHALFLGQAGLLPHASEESYVHKLIEEFHFLRQKFSLQTVPLQWKFLRMRPANFPTIRIAQLASIMSQSNTLFLKLLQTKDLKSIVPLFQIPLPEYWNTHYHFNKTSVASDDKIIGIRSIENIVINTIAPFQFFYGNQMEDDAIISQSLELLENIPAEKNQIIKLWKDAGMDCKNAADSQSLIQLYNQYCTQKKCLSCQIGAYILKPPHISKP